MFSKIFFSDTFCSIYYAYDKNNIIYKPSHAEAEYKFSRVNVA